MSYILSAEFQVDSFPNHNDDSDLSIHLVHLKGCQLEPDMRVCDAICQQVCHKDDCTHSRLDDL